MVEKDSELTKDKRFWVAMVFIMVFLTYLLVSYP